MEARQKLLRSFWPSVPCEWKYQTGGRWEEDFGSWASFSPNWSALSKCDFDSLANSHKLGNTLRWKKILPSGTKSTFEELFSAWWRELWQLLQLSTWSWIGRSCFFLKKFYVRLSLRLVNSAANFLSMIGGHWPTWSDSKAATVCGFFGGKDVDFVAPGQKRKPPLDT